MLDDFNCVKIKEIQDYMSKHYNLPVSKAIAYRARVQVSINDPTHESKRGGVYASDLL